MPRLISVNFYPRSDEDFYDAGRLRTFLTQLSQQGHYLSESDNDTISAAWWVAHDDSVPEQTRVRA